ncbi:hypothetical protein IPJ70_02570 [Candidatus Campbellbacteria bacterium]|nr:MAG: hypothetical protein IPJ70_02570 [Candidatus Campbellbacteria bacterium]
MITIPPPQKKRWVCIVQRVYLEGPHGPYAVAQAEEDTPELQGSVTFSLTPPVWKEKSFPESGSAVILSDVRGKRRGWRAFNARPKRPTDRL